MRLWRRQSHHSFGNWAIAMLFATLLTGMSDAWSQQQAPAAPVFKPEEIEALVAPIALYPDSLLTQVLMASTYPLEIVQAARWVKANPKLTGDAAVKAVGDQPWDVSVKSLVAFPQILEPMNEKLDWTQKLGDAFLAQESDVLAAAQRLRTRAQQAGTLKSNEQQKVISEPAPAGSTQTIVRIEPANPQVIYVPAYNPTVVYGSWGYPAYPPYAWPPPPAYYPGAALATGLAWGVGLAAAGAIFGSANWGGGDVNIDVNRATNIDRNFDRTNVQGGNKWQHDAGHRKGVAYRDTASREKYGKNVAGAEGRGDYRGREGTGQRTGDRGGDRSGDRGGERAGDRGRDGQGERGSDRSADRGGDRAGDRGGDRSGGRAADRGAERPTNRAGEAGGAQHRTADRAGGQQLSAANSGGSRGDSAFHGVGGGGAAQQRDLDRGRASAASSQGARGGAHGGGHGGMGGGRGGGGGGRGGRR